MIGLLLTVALIAGGMYYWIVVRKQLQSAKAKQEKLDALKLVQQQQQNPTKKTKDTTSNETEQSSSKTKVQKKKEIHSHSHGHGKPIHKNIDHPLFGGSVKGFSGEITDYDFNKEYLVVSSKDKYVRIFRLSNLNGGQIYYFQVEFGYPTAVAISNDSKYIAYAINVDKSIELRAFDLSNPDIKKRTSAPRTFAKECHKEEIMKLSFDEHNKFIISCGSKSDTFIKTWSLQGNEFASFNTAHNQHYMARFSQLRKFFLVASWTSNLKAITFLTEKVTNEFKSIAKAYGLSHSASISYVNSDNLDQQAITISKNEKCIKFWDVNVKQNLYIEKQITYSLMR